MSIKNKIKKLLFQQEKKAVLIPDYNNSDAGNKLNRQRLYEKWVCKEYWLVYDEAIPLLLGIEPGVKEKENIGIEDLWLHARRCIRKGMLSIINPEGSEKEWQIAPAAIYSWAMVSRLSVPSEFSQLMDFVLQTVGTPENSITTTENNTSEGFKKHHKDRERVLGAALSLLINVPELCKNSKGRTMTNLITKQIIDNQQQWFDKDEPSLSQSAMGDLIDQYMKLARPVIKESVNNSV